MALSSTSPDYLSGIAAGIIVSVRVDRLGISQGTAMKALIGVVLVLVCTASSGAEGGFYRWLDDQGRVHFGDRPPAGQGEALSLPADKAPPVKIDQRQRDAERRKARQRLLEVYEEERRAGELARRQAQQQAVKRQQRCLQARRKVSTYERSQALYDRQPDGSRRYLSGPERRAEIENARQAVQRWCDAD